MSTTTPAAEPAKSGGKKKILLIVLVVLLLGGAGGWFFLKPAAHKEAPKPGAVIALDPVYVNLTGGSYLKVGLALQLTDAVGKETPDGAKALDLIIAEFSQADPGDVTVRREEMKKELAKEIIDAYDDEVMGIYYTEYVTQ